VILQDLKNLQIKQELVSSMHLFVEFAQVEQTLKKGIITLLSKDVSNDKDGKD